MQMKFSDGQSEFSRVFNLTIIGYSRNLRKLDAREKLVFYSTSVATVYAKYLGMQQGASFQNYLRFNVTLARVSHFRPTQANI